MSFDEAKMDFGVSISDTGTASFGLRQLGDEARWSLRARGEVAALIKGKSGLRFPDGINQVALAGDRVTHQLGPDEWLISAPVNDRDDVRTAIDNAAGEGAHSLVDVSQRNVAFELTGPDAAAILSFGCPLDLAEGAFPVGKSTRTIFERAEILLTRSASERFRVEVWRSFAPYFVALVTRARACL